MSITMNAPAENTSSVENTTPVMNTIEVASTSARLDFDSLNWRMASQTKGEKGVLVAVADVEGYDLKAFRAVSTYEASVEQLRARIMDMDNFTKWVDGAVKASVINRIDENTQACYYENYAPWPVKNRDGVIVQHVVRIDEKTVSINIHANNELAEKKKGLVRVDYLQGSWVLQDIGSGKTKLTYQAHLDPNGNLPDWLINSMITDAPTATLKNLHNVDFSIYTPKQLELHVSTN